MNWRQTYSNINHDRLNFICRVDTACSFPANKSLILSWYRSVRISEWHVRKLTNYIFRLCGCVGQLSRYSDSLRAGRSGYRIPVGARFSAPVRTGPGAHPASCTMVTGSFPWVKRPERDVDHPPTSSAEVEGRVELYIWAFVAGCRVKFTCKVLPITDHEGPEGEQRCSSTLSWR